MLQVVFEPTIPVFEQKKTVHALDCAASVIGSLHIYTGKNSGVFALLLTLGFKFFTVPLEALLKIA
jgi:hypothetical protein